MPRQEDCVTEATGLWDCRGGQRHGLKGCLAVPHLLDFNQKNSSEVVTTEGELIFRQK